MLVPGLWDSSSFGELGEPRAAAESPLEAVSIVRSMPSSRSLRVFVSRNLAHHLCRHRQQDVYFKEHRRYAFLTCQGDPVHGREGFLAVGDSFFAEAMLYLPRQP